MSPKRLIVIEGSSFGLSERLMAHSFKGSAK